MEASLNLGVTASPGENRISPPMGNPGNRFRIRTIDDRKEMMNKKAMAVVGGNQSECIDAHTVRAINGGRGWEIIRERN